MDFKIKMNLTIIVPDVIKPDDLELFYQKTHEEMLKDSKENMHLLLNAPEGYCRLSNFETEFEFIE